MPSTPVREALRTIDVDEQQRQRQATLARRATRASPSQTTATIDHSSRLLRWFGWRRLPVARPGIAGQRDPVAVGERAARTPGSGRSALLAMPATTRPMQNARKTRHAEAGARDRRRRPRSPARRRRIVPADESESDQGTPAKTDAPSAAEDQDRASTRAGPATPARARPGGSGQAGAEHEQEAAPADEGRRLVEERRRRRDVEGDQGRQGDGEDRADGERSGRNQRRQGTGGGCGDGGGSLQGCLTVTGDAIRLGSRWGMRVLASKRGMIRAPSSESR